MAFTVETPHGPVHYDGHVTRFGPDFPLDKELEVKLEATYPQPLTPTGPDGGGDGMTDEVSVWLAIKSVFGSCPYTGTVPRLGIPEVPDGAVA